MSTSDALMFTQYRVENEAIAEVVNFANHSGFVEAGEWIKKGTDRDVYLWRDNEKLGRSSGVTRWWMRHRGPATPQGTQVWIPLKDEDIPKFLQMALLIGAV